MVTVGVRRTSRGDGPIRTEHDGRVPLGRRRTSSAPQNRDSRDAHLRPGRDPTRLPRVLHGAIPFANRSYMTLKPQEAVSSTRLPELDRRSLYCTQVVEGKRRPLIAAA